MKNFIRKLLQLTTIAAALIILLFVLTNYLVRQKSSYMLPSNIDKIVVGHSHSECSFNDRLIQNTTNLSSSGESYMYTYFKIAELLKENQNIKTVFVEFANNQINENKNDWLWGNEFMPYKYPLFGPFMDVEANYILFRHNLSGYLRSVGLLIRRNLHNLIVELDFDYTKKIGGHLRLEREEIDAALSGAKKIEEVNCSNYKKSEYNIRYLRKIIDLAESNNTKIYLVRSPLHPRYEELKNEPCFQATLRELPMIEFLDFKDFPLTNSEFGDLEHLNYRGAEKFSLFFDELLKNGLLNKKGKQTIIDDATTK